MIYDSYMSYTVSKLLGKYQGDSVFNVLALPVMFQKRCYCHYRSEMLTTRVIFVLLGRQPRLRQGNHLEIIKLLDFNINTVSIFRTVYCIFSQWPCFHVSLCCIQQSFINVISSHFMNRNFLLSV